jgi:signal transduction histidine kinase
MHNLLAAARPAPLLPRPIQLGVAMREVLEHLACARNRRVRLTIRGEDDDALVILDTVGLRRILLNLLLNALEVAPIGSGVQVAWRRLAPAEVAARFPGCPGGVVCFSVSDEGPGIPPEHLARVLEPFFTTKPTGTGLGLAVVLQIVGAHGGVLDVRSRPGQGTTVEVYLPSPTQSLPCWEATDCEAARRDACPVWREGTGFGCWNLGRERLYGEAGPCDGRCLACPVYLTHTLFPYTDAVARLREDA